MVFSILSVSKRHNFRNLHSLTVGINAVVIGALGIAAPVLHHSPFGAFILYICYIQFKRWSSKGVCSHGIFDFKLGIVALVLHNSPFAA